MPVPVSVVVPVTGRPEPLAELYREYAAPLLAAGHPIEFLFVIPVPRFELAVELERLRDAGEPIRVLRVAQPTGSGVLLRVGTTEASHETMILLPPVRRITAASLPPLIAALNGADAVFASRQGPNRNLFNRLQRRGYNAFARFATRGRFEDLGCGVGVIRRDALREAPVYGEFLRFLPLLLQREGFTVISAPAEQHESYSGLRLHRPSSYMQALVDLLGYYFLSRFTERPLRFFGFIGLLSAAAGLITLAVLFGQKLQGQGIADRPSLLLGTLLLALGVQSIAVGLVAEIIVHVSAPTRRPYRLARESDSARPTLS
jgi:dolichol-phosphate mannosyltransferase